MADKRDPEAESQGTRSASPDAGDPYAELENVFDEPIVLEDPELEPLDESRPAPSGREPSSPEAGVPHQSDQPQGALGAEEVARALWARLGTLEDEIRRGSERTLEALRRVGERMGAELAMLDKRSINLELTVARLRAMTEALEVATRRGPEREALSAPPPLPVPEAPHSSEPLSAPAKQPSFTLEDAPPVSADPDPVWDPADEETPQGSLPGTQPEHPDWRHPSYGPPPDDEPPDDR